MVMKMEIKNLLLLSLNNGRRIPVEYTVSWIRIRIQQSYSAKLYIIETFSSLQCRMLLLEK
jgi:hypothetical protein